jgi:hypothetical protein
VGSPAHRHADQLSFVRNYASLLSPKAAVSAAMKTYLQSVQNGQFLYPIFVGTSGIDCGGIERVGASKT